MKTAFTSNAARTNRMSRAVQVLFPALTPGGSKVAAGGATGSMRRALPPEPPEDRDATTHRPAGLHMRDLRSRDVGQPHVPSGPAVLLRGMRRGHRPRYIRTERGLGYRFVGLEGADRVS
jgi:hypothetical protein